MARSPLFDKARRVMQVGHYCALNGLSAREGLTRLAEQQAMRERALQQGGLSRRHMLQALGLAGVGLVAGARTRPVQAAGKASWKNSNARVAVIGGGMSGLAAADRLIQGGIAPIVFEANSRLGGRVKTYRGLPGGQNVEAGGEMIDNLHKTMLGYANRFGLAVEDYNKAPGDDIFFRAGAFHSEEDLVDEYCAMVQNMRPDYQACSGAPTFYSHTPADVALDCIDLATYLDTRAAGLPLVREMLNQAYIAEYGLECSEQSSLNMLLFVHLDCSSNFREFGVYSDERYHVTGGNDGIIAALEAAVVAGGGTIETGAFLNSLSRNGSGEYVLGFSGASDTVTCDAVILTTPFSVLRRSVTLDSSLGLSADKLRAINDMGYGKNCKTMIQFQGRPWYDLYGGNGLIYSDRYNVQNTWETNWTNNSSGTTVLTDYAGGDRGEDLQVTSSGSYCGDCHVGPVSDLTIDDALIQAQVADFLGDLDAVLPGVKAEAARSGQSYVAYRGHWLAQRTARGSYTCYTPGQFTEIAGLEGESKDGLKFAGEHANSFYEWQGFMEGAALSGIDAAEEVLGDIKAGRI